MLHLFASLWGKKKILGVQRQRKHLPLETNKQDHLYCVNYENIFFFSCWTNPFLRNVKHTIEFAEFPVKLDFDLDEVQPRVLCSQIFFKVNEMNTLQIYINVFGGFCKNSSFF